MAKTTVNQELDKLGRQIVADAKAYPVPVDTGALKNSLKYQFQFMSENSFRLVISEMYYGKYVNDGTYKMPARPYMTTAINKNVGPSIQSIVEVAIGELTDKLKYTEANFNKKK